MSVYHIYNNVYSNAPAQDLPTPFSTARGIPYPLNQLPVPGEPFTDVRLMDTLVPLLERLSGVASALAALPQENTMTPKQRQDALRLLAEHLKVAPEILRCWWEAKESP
jgi:hypothetical protein